MRRVLAAALLLGLGVQPVYTQAARGLGVAVVDFYAPSPLPPFEGLVPEESAADDLTDLLIQSAANGVTVIPRAAVRQAEAAMGWRGSDVLRFARLRDLARTLGVDRLAVGSIRLDLDQGGSGGAQNRGGGRGVRGAFASVTVQAFDANQGRIIVQAQESAYEFGAVPSRLAERILRNILELTLPSVLPALFGAAR